MRRWPWPFLLLLLGAVIATARLVPPFTVSPTLVLVVFLPPLLFDAGFSLRAVSCCSNPHAASSARRA